MDPYTSLIILALAAFLSWVFQPLPPGVGPPPTADDFSIPTVEEGRPIGVAFGDCWIESPTVMWWGDLSTYPVQKRVGKKG